MPDLGHWTLTLFRRRKRWDFLWEFPGTGLFELRAEDPKMPEFEARKDGLRSRLRKGEISSGEYIEGFRELCIELGTSMESIPDGYSISREYSNARVYSRPARTGKS